MMEEITKVVLIKNAVETLGYFSKQLALELEHLGYDIYFIDYDALYESLGGLSKFAVKGQTALLTFNFIGLSDEEIFLDESGSFIWEKYEMKYLNILVDHPLYYHTRLLCALPRMTIFCVDREHVGYIRRFYPGLKVKFLPLAGNVRLDETVYSADVYRSFDAAADCYDTVWSYEKELIPYEKRKYDFVFTANYVPIEQLETGLLKQGKEYAAFYHGILDDLIAHPSQVADVVMERHIRDELGEVPDGDIRAAMAGMLILDLYVRTYFRGEIIKGLAEADIKVHVFGADWERLACKKPQNIVKNSGQVSSAVCVDAVRNAKISLNIMPWFKDGAHDRIFTAMLQQTIALTDDSRYLRRQFTDGEDIVYFSLEGRTYLPDIVGMLLRDETHAMRIAKNGYQQAFSEHTWRERARKLMEEFGRY